jgi:hypothetical protein
MPTKVRLRTDLKDRRYTVRVDGAMQLWIEQQAAAGGSRGGQEFIRRVLEREKNGRNTAFDSLESKLAATLGRQAQALETVRNEGLANHATILALAQLILSTVPLPGKDNRLILEANFAKRYAQFLQSIGIGLRTTFAESLQQVIEESIEAAEDAKY